jgi:hypothetical protein
MPCLPLPALPLPSIPAPFSLIPELPKVPSIQLDVCCQAINLGEPNIPIPLPPLVLNTGVIQLMNKGIAVVRAYLDALPIDCPRE